MVKLYLIVTLLWTADGSDARHWVLKGTFPDNVSCQAAGNRWLYDEAMLYIRSEEARGIKIGAPYSCIDAETFRYQVGRGAVTVIGGGQ